MPEPKTGGTSATSEKVTAASSTEARAVPLPGASPVPAAGGSGSATAHADAGNPPGENVAGEGGTGASEINDTILSPGKPVGAQTEPALFTVNGSIPHDMVPSPSGLVPASLHADEGAREVALEAARAGAREARRQRRNSRQRLTQEQLERMSPAEVRAVAHDRGYEIGEGGRRALVSRFIRAQEEDDSDDLWNPEESEGQSSSRAVPLPVGSGHVPGASGAVGAAAGGPITPGRDGQSPAEPRSTAQTPPKAKDEGK